MLDCYAVVAEQKPPVTWGEALMVKLNAWGQVCSKSLCFVIHWVLQFFRLILLWNKFEVRQCVFCDSRLFLSVCQSVGLLAHLPACLPACLCPSICLSVYLPVMSVYLCVSTPVRLSVYQSLCLCVYVPVCLCLCPSVTLSPWSLWLTRLY